ncbi:MAG: molybdopterin-binding protein, partial [Desulforhopalus sp.]
MRKTVPVEQSVGMVLPHDVTEIVKDVKKEAAFKKGHIIRPEDIEHLKRLGKENIYVLSLNELEIHENEAAVILADALSGQGVTYDNSPEEGKIALKASLDGLLRINKEALYRFNLLGEVMCATLHDNTPVRQGETVGATRLIPLIGSRSLIAEAKKIARDGDAIIRVHALVKKRIGLVITGNEVYHGRIEDRFEEVLRAKAQELGSVI